MEDSNCKTLYRTSESTLFTICKFAHHLMTACLHDWLFVSSCLQLAYYYDVQDSVGGIATVSSSCCARHAGFLCMLRSVVCSQHQNQQWLLSGMLQLDWFSFQLHCRPVTNCHSEQNDIKKRRNCPDKFHIFLFLQLAKIWTDTYNKADDVFSIRHIIVALEKARGHA